ncbi:multidrug effflux MFS transporter [Profundibacter amoris]|uniref:MFS transporter n=1 Tax=Profundibacter amoris TaxID=2171755 RepID=A0A347UGB7_9RHOB|nr:multidrug effflux MFS transporter [Profundibacter amoris]AXX97895.1 MFS transporter [Profundibacter amoris]
MNTPQSPLGKREFIALMGMTSASIAFSIDAMLPSLPEIGQALTPEAINRAQLVLTSFVLGMGIGTFFTGPLSDAFGRRRVLLGGFFLYMIGALLGMLAGSLELLLAARLIQGLGAAGPRVVAMAVIRDRFSGRQMAQVMSFVMMVFTLVPAFAPSMGAGIIYLVGWRGLFGAFVLFAIINSLWFGLRQPETLLPENRREFRPAKLWEGVKEVLANRTVRTTIMVQTMIFGSLFGMLSTTQQVFDITFGQGANFPLWFGGIALVAGTASVVNATFVVRLGMRRIIRVTLMVQIMLSGGFAILVWSGLMPATLYFPAFLLWMTSVFFMAGMTIGNLNAIAMEPMGHMAGMAASVTSALFTVSAVLIAAPIGLAFDGTPLPLAIGVFSCAAVALALMQMIRREP